MGHDSLASYRYSDIVQYVNLGSATLLGSFKDISAVTDTLDNKIHPFRNCKSRSSLI